ncbi:hypothetical protein FA048_13655 [Pedobacter polaris]|uniref:Uncharacterized protein n=1 Tax=Pedobacter polaris TaxID=2571273 RepID=A0A4U1CNM1_9SPHI|nr:hypothetical protein [Pedobacter polaris]TKC08198.1 hypothetical protein FA048_13655 [Pedobacter polaris]
MLTRLLASNPGSNYGCKINNSPATIYAHWQKTDMAPGNPWWGPFHYYNTSSPKYPINYSSNLACGEVNASASFVDSNQPCFVNFGGGNYVQGNLGTFTLTPGSYTPCPIDDYLPALFCFIGAYAIYFIKRRSLV